MQEHGPIHQKGGLRNSGPFQGPALGRQLPTLAHCLHGRSCDVVKLLLSCAYVAYGTHSLLHSGLYSLIRHHCTLLRLRRYLSQRPYARALHNSLRSLSRFSNTCDGPQERHLDVRPAPQDPCCYTVVPIHRHHSRVCRCKPLSGLLHNERRRQHNERLISRARYGVMCMVSQFLRTQKTPLTRGTEAVGEIRLSISHTATLALDVRFTAHMGSPLDQKVRDMRSAAFGATYSSTSPLGGLLLGGP